LRNICQSPTFAKNIAKAFHPNTLNELKRKEDERVRVLENHQLLERLTKVQPTLKKKI